MTDLAPLLTSPTAIVGATGAGKSYTARGAVEVLLELGRRVVIIDPTGVWWGLRSASTDNPDGNGFPVIVLGGDHGDLPLTEHDGRTVATAFATRQVQAVLDVSEMTGGQMVRFLTDFFDTLYAQNKEALHLVVDEADAVCPQNPMPDQRALSGIFDKIVRRGRVKGFRPLMITQRPAVLHKNVLSQIGTLVALKLSSPQDRKAIEEWVKGNADTDQARTVMKSLPGLATGEGWVWSPAAGVLQRQRFPTIRTYDSGRTPEAGEHVQGPAMAPVDVGGIAAAIAAATPSETKGKAGQHTSSVDVEAIERAAFLRGVEEGEGRGRVAGISIGISRARSAIDALRVHEITLEDAAPAPPAPTAATARKARRPAQSRHPGQDPLFAAALSIWPVRVTWPALAAMCGRKASGGHFNTTRKALIDGGLLHMDGELVTLVDPPAHPDGVIPADLLAERLPQPAAKMFDVIRSRPGVTIAELANALGMQPRGGHWNTGMSMLRRNNLISETAGGLRIAPELLG